MPEEDLPMERRDEVSRAALERCTKSILQHIAWWLFICNMWCFPFNSDAAHLVTVLYGICFSFFICQGVFPSVKKSKEKILVQLPLQRCREVHLEGGVGWGC